MWALDKATGNRVAEIELPGTTSGKPMTFMHDGKQYIVVSVSPDGEAAELVALALP
jgi:quinoprotein glucose dehydrogenase